MAKIEVTRTELVWPGKYDEDGTLKEVPRVSLPFQVIETVNESRATREAKKGGVQGTLFDVYEGKEGDTFEAGWRNKLAVGKQHVGQRVSELQCQFLERESDGFALGEEDLRQRGMGDLVGLRQAGANAEGLADFERDLPLLLLARDLLAKDAALRERYAVEAEGEELV